MSEHHGSLRSKSWFSFLFGFGFLVGFVKQENLTQALDGKKSHTDLPFLESHCRLTQLWLVKLRKTDDQSPGLKVSLMLKNENWMKNLLTSLDPRSERSSPCYIVFEYRFF